VYPARTLHLNSANFATIGTTSGRPTVDRMVRRTGPAHRRPGRGLTGRLGAFVGRSWR
jgi:hypothetical protein